MGGLCHYALLAFSVSSVIIFEAQAQNICLVQKQYVMYYQGLLGVRHRTVYRSVAVNCTADCCSHDCCSPGFFQPETRTIIAASVFALTVLVGCAVAVVYFIKRRDRRRHQASQARIIIRPASTHSGPNPPPYTVSSNQAFPYPQVYGPYLQPDGQYPPAPFAQPKPQGPWQYPVGQYPQPLGQYPQAQATYPYAQATYPQAQGPNMQVEEPNVQAQGSNPQTQGSYPQAQATYPQAQGPNIQAQGSNPQAQGPNIQAQESNPQAQDPSSATQGLGSRIPPPPPYPG